MKKLLFMLLLVTTACGYAPIDNSKPVIVTEIESYDEVYCNYYGIGNSSMTETVTVYQFKFRDSCGKYQVGDTIKFVK